VLCDARFHGGVLYTTAATPASVYGGDVERKGEVQWKSDGAPYVSSMLYYDGLIYMATEMGIVSCVAQLTEVALRERFARRLLSVAG